MRALLRRFIDWLLEPATEEELADLEARLADEDRHAPW
ncbi:hypothetical protein GALAXY_59 [Arthrobacter phage Galaxy]|uniref:Uncharacterized protein n=1 Tax=Arthrobacter phage Galaxy TaxID=1772326 RepID=A0A0U4IU95_9CAUD|nr:hypothetical protein FDG93_gp59 [Arthrobacter phage Galaxy]ALY08903.1 hypothetical protein GALAXY_59 [Arthrobacter phage Galaxy]